MKLEISGVFSTLALYSALSFAVPTHANLGLFQSLFKRISSARCGLASEVSTQHKDLTNRLLSQSLVKTVKVHHDFTPFLKLSDNLDAETAEKISGLIDFTVNGFPIRKTDISANAYTLIPVRQDQPLIIEMSINRGNVSSLLEIIKNNAKNQGVALPSWSESRLMRILNYFSFRVNFERPLDKETEDYFLSVILCEQNDFAQLISEPNADSIYALAKKYGQPGLFDFSLNLPRIEPV